MKSVSAAFALALALAAPLAQSAVYFAAHPDDLVFLMGRNAFRDIRAGYPTVIVILTAGDAGNGVGANIYGRHGDFDHNNSGHQYYRVRLNAHHEAIRYWVHAAGTTPVVMGSESFGPSIPAVEKVTIGNVTIYNLNLPDSHLEGFLPEGSYNPELPGKHALNQFTVLRDITRTNEYTREGFKEILRQIIRRNNIGARTVVVNFHEYDPYFSEYGYNDKMLFDPLTNSMRLMNLTIQDHRDHTATGKWVVTALDEHPAYHCLYRAAYMGYAVVHHEYYVRDEATYWQEYAAFPIMDNVLKIQGNFIRQGTGTPLSGHDNPYHRAFIGRNRHRDTGHGNGACSFN